MASCPCAIQMTSNVCCTKTSVLVKLFDLDEQDKMHTVLVDFEKNKYSTLEELVAQVMTELQCNEEQKIILAAALRAASPLFCVDQVIVTQMEQQYICDTVQKVFGAKDAFMNRLKAKLVVFPRSIYESSTGNVIIRFGPYNEAKQSGNCIVTVFANSSLLREERVFKIFKKERKVEMRIACTAKLPAQYSMYLNVSSHSAKPSYCNCGCEKLILLEMVYKHNETKIVFVNGTFSKIVTAKNF